MAFSPANVAHLQRAAGNTGVTSFLHPDRGRSSTSGPEEPQPIQRQADANPPAGVTTEPVTARVINMSGGGTITVYGSFAASVEIALADGWLSFLEMGNLSIGVGKVSDDAGHDVMMMLTQRDLALRGDKTIPNLSETERLTWEGPDGHSGLRMLRTLSRQAGSGHLVTQYAALSGAPYFTKKIPAGEGKGSTPEDFNLADRLSAINSEPTLAPDDKSSLGQIALLHAAMAYPGSVLNGIALPVPTEAQRSQYVAGLLKPYLLTRLAVALGIPPPF
jgi:hypothetical protein